MSLRCVIVDDEYLAIQVIETYSRQHGAVVVKATFTKPVDALTYLKTNPVELLFLDIQMPQLDGFELLKQLAQPPMVVFTTARHDYAVKAFELEVLDYLVKPVPYDRFEKAVRRAEDLLKYKNAFGGSGRKPLDYLMIRADYRMHKIQFDQVEYIEGLSEYVKIHTRDKLYVTLLALRDLNEQLPADQFVRIHKSFIVSIAQIQSYNYSQVLLKNGKELAIGRAHKEDFLNRVNSRIS